MCSLTHSSYIVSLDLIPFWGELLKALEDVLLRLREGNQEVLTVLRCQQLHETLQLMDIDVFRH